MDSTVIIRTFYTMHGHGDKDVYNMANSFEADTSLTRNDFFMANGDDHSFNGTLFAMMTDTVASTSSADDP